MGPESASRGRRDPPPLSSLSGTAGHPAGRCLRHSSGSDGTPLLSARRASREPFSGRPRLGRWDPQASPWERRAATPSVPWERRDPSPCHPARPFPCQPLGAAALRIRSWGRRGPRSDSGGGGTPRPDPGSGGRSHQILGAAGPPEWLQGPLGAAADRAASLQVRGDTFP